MGGPERIEVGGITGEVVMANPINACSRLNNKQVVSGKIVLVHRGVCTFVEKVRRAQEAHAKAVIVVNLAGDIVIMAGDGLGITIPSVSVSKTVGEQLMRFIPGLTLRLAE